jgi:hypothetical protein
MILYKNQNFIYLYKNIFLKSISPALPLVGAFIILSDDAKYFLSSLSVTIQSYMSVILFGAISRFSVKQGRLQYFVGVRKLNEFKFISLLNAITLFLMLTIFGKISSVEICSIFVSLAVVFLSVDVVSEYASSSAVVIKSRNIFFILLGGLIIFYFYFLINDLFVYALFVVPSVIVLLDWGGGLYTQRRLHKFPKLRMIKKLWFNYLKLNMVTFFVGFITPGSLYAVGYLINKNQGKSLYVEFTQMYSLFTLLVFLSNVYIQKILVESGRKNNWIVVCNYMLRGVAIPVVVLFVLIAAMYFDLIDDRYFDRSPIFWVFLTAIIFILQSISTQILYVKNKIYQIMIFTILWFFLLTALISVSQDAYDVWRSYSFSFLLLGVIQYWYLRGKNA